MRVTYLVVAALLCGLCGVVGGPSIVRADEKPDIEAAKKHYKDARAAESAGDYDTAASEYAAAYEITKDPKLLYSIGKAYEQGGNKDAAIVYYRRYLNERKDAPDGPEVKAHIAELEGGNAVPPGGGGDDKIVPPGGGDDKIVPPGGGDDKVVPPGGGGDDSGPGPDVGGGDDTPTFVEGNSRWERTAGWVSIGIAAVALTSGAVLGESALSNEEDVQRLVDYRDPMTQAPAMYSGKIQQDYEDAKADGQRDEQLAIVAFSIAGVAAVAATVFFILDPGPAEVPGGDARSGKNVAKGARRFAPSMVAPMIAPSGAGVFAGWEF